jgi:ribonuclease H / adenosylcobalamin/alpha-ribazole phosphatase
VLTLLLTRHGHTVRSEPEQYLGQHVEAPLSERGRADAARLAERLAGVPIHRLLTSPLPRAVETAAIIAGGRVPAEPDDRLKEMDYGAWEGHTVEEVERRFPGEFARYVEDPSSFLFDGGESGSLVARRVGPFIDDLLDWAEGSSNDRASGDRASDGADRSVLVVGHSSLNRVMAALVLGVPLRDYRRRFQFDWASLTVLRWESRVGGAQLVLGNDVAHLRGTAGVTWD